MEKHTNPCTKLEEEILAPYTYLLQIKGKKLRVKIADAFNHWLELNNVIHREIVETVDMLHTATLLFDDVQDDAHLRRGIPAAHRVYGVPRALNTSMYVLFLGFGKIMKLHPKGGEIFASEFLDAIRGQGSDLYWRENFRCPTVQEYNKMAKQKTGRMFSIGVRLCQQFSNYKTDLCPLALQLGLYFQIRDDYCNLKHQEALEEWPGEEDVQVIFIQKLIQTVEIINALTIAEAHTENSFCEDITEGKFSLAIIHAMSTPLGEDILDILRKRTQDVELKKRCVSLLEKAGSLQYVRDVLEDLDRSIRTEVAQLGENPLMEAVLDEMMSWRV